MSESNEISNGIKSFVRMLFHGGAMHDVAMQSPASGAPASRDGAVSLGLVSRDRFGWNYLTQKGHDFAVFMGFGDEKLLDNAASYPSPELLPEAPVSDAPPVEDQSAMQPPQE